MTKATEPKSAPADVVEPDPAGKANDAPPMAADATAQASTGPVRPSKEEIARARAVIQAADEEVAKARAVLDAAVAAGPSDEEIAKAQADVDAAAARQTYAAVDVRGGMFPGPTIGHKLRPGDACPECGRAIGDVVSPMLSEEDAKKAAESREIRDERAVEFHYATFHAAAPVPQFRAADR